MREKLLLAAAILAITLTSCVSYNTGNNVSDSDTFSFSTQTKNVMTKTEKEESSSTAAATTTKIETTTSATITEAVTSVEPEKQTAQFSINDIPSFSNAPYCEVNNNKPFFTNDEITTQSYEYYPELDDLGRCGSCIACISLDMMPKTERERIGMIKPSGWQISKYDFIEGKHLFQRCHLIGYQLTGENANLSNLITGTRYMNIQGMLPYENKTANYIKSTGNHVMYRVTPVFEGDNLVATGVLMEAYSVEDNGQGLCFNVFCWNSQPGVVIDYATGDNHFDENYDVNILDSIVEDIDEPLVLDSEKTNNSDEQSQIYILNTNTKKIHYPWCSSVDDMAEHNKQEFTGDINELIEQGFSPCKRCNPM